MKKKLTMCLIAGAVTLLLAACNTDNETINTNATTEPAEDNLQIEPSTATNNSTQETPPTNEPANPTSTPTEAEFTFPFNGTVINLNQNMAEILDTLGEPSGVRQTPSCAFDGYDRIFGFGAINIHTYPVGDEDFIQIISIRDDSVTTPGGIRLGNSWGAVLDAYGTDYVQDFSKHTFTQGDTTLSFFVEDGIVVEITYALIMD